MRLADLCVCMPSRHAQPPERPPPRKPARRTAPEVVRGEPRSCASDIFAFGMILAATFSSTELYHKQRQLMSDDNIVSAVAYFDLRPDLSELCPQAIRDLILDMWIRNPAKRPGIREVGAALEAAIQASHVFMASARRNITADRQKRLRRIIEDMTAETEEEEMLAVALEGLEKLVDRVEGAALVSFAGLAEASHHEPGGGALQVASEHPEVQVELPGILRAAAARAARTLALQGGLQRASSTPWLQQLPRAGGSASALSELPQSGRPLPRTSAHPESLGRASAGAPAPGRAAAVGSTSLDALLQDPRRAHVASSSGGAGGKGVAAYSDWLAVSRHATKSGALEELQAWSMLLVSGGEVVGFALVVWQGTPFSIGLGADHGLLEEFAESVAAALGCAGVTPPHRGAACFLFDARTAPDAPPLCACGPAARP